MAELNKLKYKPNTYRVGYLSSHILNARPWKNRQIDHHLISANY